MNERQRRHLEQLLADERTVRAAAATVRGAPDTSRLAALSDPHIADCCAEVLDALADELAAMPAQVRDHTVRVCREFIGDGLDMPTRRRTRRR